jgi:hypothetical protein
MLLLRYWPKATPSGPMIGRGGQPGRRRRRRRDEGSSASSGRPARRLVRSSRTSSEVSAPRRRHQAGNAPATELSFEAERRCPITAGVPTGRWDVRVRGFPVPQRFSKQQADRRRGQVLRSTVEAAKTRRSRDGRADWFCRSRSTSSAGLSHADQGYMFLFDADKGFVQELADRTRPCATSTRRTTAGPPDHGGLHRARLRQLGRVHRYGGPNGSGGHRRRGRSRSRSSPAS